MSSSWQIIVMECSEWFQKKCDGSAGICIVGGLPDFYSFYISFSIFFEVVLALGVLINLFDWCVLVVICTHNMVQRAVIKASKLRQAGYFEYRKFFSTTEHIGSKHPYTSTSV